MIENILIQYIPRIVRIRYEILVIFLSSTYFWFLPVAETSVQNNLFFGADTERNFRVISGDPLADHYRNLTHPFFTILATIPVRTIHLFNSEINALTSYVLVFGVMGAFFFWKVLSSIIQPLLALSILLVFFASNTVRIWSILSETFIATFATLMLSTYLIIKRKNWVLIFLISMSANIFCLLLPVICSIIIEKRKYKNLAKNLLIFSPLAIAISIFQRSLAPSSGYFFDFVHISSDKEFVAFSIDAIPFRIFDFFISPFIMPHRDLLTLPLTSRAIWSNATSTRSTLNENVAFWAMLICILLILSLLAFAVITTISTRFHTENKVLRSIVLFTIFQLIFYSFYGDEPFLYSYMFFPFILVIIGFAMKRIPRLGILIFISLACLMQLVNFSPVDVEIQNCTVDEDSIYLLFMNYVCK